MKKTIFVLIFIYLGFTRLWAVECTLVVEDKAKFFLKSEINNAMINSIKILFQVEDLKIYYKPQPINDACHFKVVIAIYTNVLSTHVHVDNDEFIGGSHKLTPDGLQEAVIRAFYKKPSTKKKTCRLFRKKYNLNCILYK